MSENLPPPWLINMQRYGPPPCYPNMRIPGINAPIPAGCEYGLLQGQWGKPPIDEVRVISASPSSSFFPLSFLFPFPSALLHHISQGGL